MKEKVYLIKGRYLDLERKQPITYFGTLYGAIRYITNNHFISFGEDIEIVDTERNYTVAKQRWVQKVDEAGEYYEGQDWQWWNGNLIEFTYDGIIYGRTY